MSLDRGRPNSIAQPGNAEEYKLQLPAAIRVTAEERWRDLREEAVALAFVDLSSAAGQVLEIHEMVSGLEDEATEAEEPL